MSNELDCEEDIIKLYQELANIFEVISTEEYIATLKLKYQVFEDTYGNSDKKSIKEQRNLVAALLKNRKVEESLEESEDILVCMSLLRKNRRKSTERTAWKWGRSSEPSGTYSS